MVVTTKRSLPSVHNVDDPVSKAFLIAAREKLEVIHGDRGSFPQRDRFLSVGEMLDLGIIAIDRGGFYYKSGVVTDNGEPLFLQWLEEDYSQAPGLSGEANLGSNVGTGSVGIYDGKTALTLDFRTLLSANAILSIALDGANQKLDFTIVESAITHNNLGGIGTDDHHAQSHTVVSHSDTTATGAELDTLTDGSNADALHVHNASNMKTRVTLTSNTTLSSAHYLVSVDASSGAVTLTLDASPVDGQEVDIFCVDATNTVTLTGTVNGTTNPTMVQYDAFRLVYNSDAGFWELR